MEKGEYRWLAETTEHFRIYSGKATFTIEGKRTLVQLGGEIIVPKGLTF
ncbi:cupin domain-containing protein [Photorhabdus sp. SF281]